jgi:hypothetical protein
MVLHDILCWLLSSSKIHRAAFISLNPPCSVQMKKESTGALGVRQRVLDRIKKQWLPHIIVSVFG